MSSERLISRRKLLLGTLATLIIPTKEASTDPISTPFGDYDPGLPLPTPIPETPTLPPRYIERGNTQRPEIALTFDGGAGSRNTPPILDILAQKEVRSNMFLAGRWIEQNPDLTTRMINDGHHIVNHSWDHLHDFTTLSDNEIRNQLQKTEAKAQEFGISTKPYFRPPFGGFNERVIRICAEEGFSQFVYWTYDSGDWKPNLSPGEVHSEIVNNASNGAIFVMHLDSWQEPLILASAIDAVREKGFTLTTVPNLLRKE